MSGKVTVLSTSEDGDVSMTVMDEAELLHRLRRGDYGQEPRFKLDRTIYDLRDSAGIVVIRGEPVAPSHDGFGWDWSLP